MAYTKNIIRDKATELVLQAGVRGQFPVPLESIASFLGYQSVEFFPDESTQNVSGAVNHRQKKIYINCQDSARRQMFTLAHEIGHIALHGESNGDFVDFRSDSPNDNRETEANSFAGELLMPENHFRATWLQWDGVASVVAATYGVSEDAAKVRARVLGLRG